MPARNQPRPPLRRDRSRTIARRSLRFALFFADELLLNVQESSRTIRFLHGSARAPARAGMRVRFADRRRHRLREEPGPPGPWPGRGELAVQQRERLKSVSAGGPARAGALRIGCIEGVEERVAHVALAKQIKRSPEVFGRVSVLGPEVDCLSLGEDQVLDFLFDRGEHAGAVHPGIQLARDGQHRVAHAFGIKPAA